MTGEAREGVPDEASEIVAGVAHEVVTGGGPARVEDEALGDVREGLSANPRTLPSKYFYDRRGSELFEEITRLPEYYLTRTEQALMDGPVGGWIRDRRVATLVELGAGSATKTRSLLDAMDAAGSARAYLPTDVSADFLEETARSVRDEYPGLDVQPLVADMSRGIGLPEGLPRPVLVALLGSTLGNFRPAGAVALLARVRDVLRPGDAFLLGADLRPGEGKAVEELVSAYDDPGGVTAAFNRNILRVLNRRSGTDFDPDAWGHEARYDPEEGRIEMHLRPLRPQTVGLPDGTTFRIDPDETIRTEISCKYDRRVLDDLLERAGLEVAEWVTDPDGRYAMLLARLPR